jgi:membrane dipeptidase
MDVQSVHASAMVVDALGGQVVPMPAVRDGKDFFDRLKDVGLNTISVTIEARFATFEDVLSAVYKHEMVWEIYGNKARLVLTPRDMEQCKADGKIGVLMGLQTGSPVGDDLRRVTLMHRLGIRMMAITYMEGNLLGAGCLEPRDSGLTHLGRQVVREMNRVGMIVDLSHVGDRTSLDAIEISSKPVIFSHSNPRSVSPHPRNIPDEAIKAVAAKGGLVCATPYGPCCSPDPASGVQATMEDYMRHIDYLVEMVGVDHVGIGSDRFEGKGEAEWNATTKRRYPESVAAFTHQTVTTVGFADMSAWPSITENLLARGYAEKDVKQIIGGNFLRVFREISAV